MKTGTFKEQRDSFDFSRVIGLSHEDATNLLQIEIPAKGRWTRWKASNFLHTEGFEYVKGIGWVSIDLIREAITPTSVKNPGF